MMRRWIVALLAGAISLAVWNGSAEQAKAQNYELNRFYYYPYYYFPHNYWPIQSPKYPEKPGEPYQRPPAYMAYPPFKEDNWRYEFFTEQRYYRGFHFWLDQM